MLDDLFKNLFRGRPGGGAAPTGPVSHLVVGLGNPGREYENTRHNAGFLAVDHMADKWGFSMKKLQFKSLCGEAMVAGKRVLFLKPSTYMNRSGEAVREALAYHKAPVENLIVVSDDVALDVGRMRIRRSGSDGGQKGLQNIIYLTGKDSFPRIRIGVGKKAHPDMALADWVLSQFTPDDRKALEPLFQNALEAVELIVRGEIDKAMGKFNG